MLFWMECRGMDRMLGCRNFNLNGSWNGLINTSGDYSGSVQSDNFDAPENIDLNSDGTNLLVAGQYTAASWGLKEICPFLNR